MVSPSPEGPGGGVAPEEVVRAVLAEEAGSVAGIQGDAKLRVDGAVVAQPRLMVAVDHDHHRLRAGIKGVQQGAEVLGGILDGA